MGTSRDGRESYTSPVTSTARSNRGPAAAADNRAALLRAATEIFSEQGPDAPLSAIAKRAGVSQGVLYRHFRSRGELAFAAFERNLDDLDAIVERGGTLAEVLGEVVAQVTEAAALIELTATLRDDPHLGEFERRMRGILSSTLEAGRAAGTVPDTYGIDDVMLSIRMFAGALNGALPDERPAIVSRSLAMLRIHLP